MKHNKELIKQIADEVQDEYNMGGLADGLYLEFATDVATRYAERINLKPDFVCKPTWSGQHRCEKQCETCRVLFG